VAVVVGLAGIVALVERVETIKATAPQPLARREPQEPAVLLAVAVGALVFLTQPQTIKPMPLLLVATVAGLALKARGPAEPVHLALSITGAQP
jgi:hypothetical protein